jgi:hypothetical protein
MLKGLVGSQVFLFPGEVLGFIIYFSLTTVYYSVKQTLENGANLKISLSVMNGPLARNLTRIRHPSFSV